MDADLDLLLIAAYCTVDDLLPERAENARRRITDQEVITLCIAQAMLDCRSDEQFLAIAARRLVHPFPALPERSAFHNRRLRLSAVIEGLIAEFARHSPGFYDELVLVDSTPVECARSVETTRRSQLGDAADYGYCASHSRFFWGFRLHALFALDGTPRALALTSPKIDEKTVCLQLVARCEARLGFAQRRQTLNDLFATSDPFAMLGEPPLSYSMARSEALRTRMDVAYHRPGVAAAAKATREAGWLRLGDVKAISFDASIWERGDAVSVTTLSIFYSPRLNRSRVESCARPINGFEARRPERSG